MVDIGAPVAENGVEEAVRRSLADDELGVYLLGYLVVEAVEHEAVAARIHGTYRRQQIAVDLVVALRELVVLVLFAYRVDAVRRDNGERSCICDVVGDVVEEVLAYDLVLQLGLQQGVEYLLRLALLVRLVRELILAEVLADVGVEDLFERFVVDVVLLD